MIVIASIGIVLMILVAFYESINITWWLSTYGKDSFTKHIKFCIKNSRVQKRSGK